MRRIVSIDANGVVCVTSRLEKADESKPVNAPDGMRFTNWGVTQVPVTPYVDVRLIGQERVLNGADGSPAFPEPEKISENILRFSTAGITNQNESAKACFDADMMSIPVHGGTLVIWQEPASESESSEPERGQLYVSGKAGLRPGVEPYMEIEWCQPWPNSEQRVWFRFDKD